MAKVCHFTSAHQPGDVRIFHKQCVSLAKAGYEVYLVQPGESCKEKGVHIVGLGQPPAGRLMRMTSYAKKAYKTALSLDADIYEFHDPELLPWGLKLKKKGKKVVFDSHEMYVEQIMLKNYLPRWTRSLVAALYGVYENYVLKRIDGITFESLRGGTHPFAGRCPHTALLNNVPLLDELYDFYDPAADKYPRSLVYVGGLSHLRGITQLVQAAALSGSVAYLAGKFMPPEYRQQLEAMPEYSCVQYQGILDRDGIRNLLQRCQIGIATVFDVGQYYRNDNLLTKTYEYMAMGLPVIITCSDYNERLMEEYPFGICVNPQDPKDIAAAIQYLLDHPEEARRMGENGRRAVRERFNWEVEVNNLLNLYERILNG